MSAVEADLRDFGLCFFDEPQIVRMTVFRPVGDQTGEFQPSAVVRPRAGAAATKVNSTPTAMVERIIRCT